MHALRCALLLVSLVFGEVFFGGSAPLHDFFLHFLAKCTLFVTINLIRKIENNYSFQRNEGITLTSSFRLQ